MKFTQFFLLLFMCGTMMVSANPLDSLKSLEEYITHHQIDAQEKDGLYYAIEEEGKGAYPKAGDYVMIRYTGQLLNGKVFDASEEDRPFVFQLGYRIVIQGWEKGVPLFKVGSKGQLFVPPTLAYGRSGLGAVPPNSPLIFNIEVLDVMDIAAYDRYMMEQERRERAAYEAHIRDQFKKDKRLINDYAADQKLRTKRTASGLSYTIKKKGKGETAKPGDVIKVHYEGFLLDGTKFDSSHDRKQPFEFVLGRRKVIQGWDEGLQFFKKGSEGWLLIPSKLAYGGLAIEEKGISVPGDSALAFKIKVLDIKQPTAKK